MLVNPVIGSGGCRAWGRGGEQNKGGRKGKNGEGETDGFRFRCGRGGTNDAGAGGGGWFGGGGAQCNSGGGGGSSFIAGGSAGARRCSWIRCTVGGGRWAVGSVRRAVGGRGG